MYQIVAVWWRPDQVIQVVDIDTLDGLRDVVKQVINCGVEDGQELFCIRVINEQMETLTVFTMESTNAESRTLH